VYLVIIILLSATFTFFSANFLGIPLSPSEVTVGGGVGVGGAYQVLYVDSILKIVFFWIAVPIVAFALACAAGYAVRWLERRDRRWKGIGSSKWKTALTLLVVLAGFLEAFSAGMNNVANAVGPLVGANLMDSASGVFWGGLFVAV